MLEKLGDPLEQVRHEQYYWVRYWYWVILGCYRKLVLVLGIVKAFCKILVMVLGIGYLYTLGVLEI